MPLLAILEEPATLDALSQQILEALAASTPWFDVAIRRELSDLVRTSADRLGPILAGTATGFETPPEALRLGRRMARLDVSVAEVLRAFGDMRQQTTDLLTTVLALLEIPTDQQLSLALETNQLVMWWLDALQLAVLAEHAQERDSLSQATQRRRQDLVRRVLDTPSADLDEAGRQLGYNLRGTHTALLTWPTPDADDDTAASTFARRLQQRAGALLVEGGARETWVWLPGGEAAAVIETPPPGVQIAVGRTLPGADGFRLSHRHAQACRRLAPHLRDSPAVVQFDDHDVVALLVTDDVITLAAFARAALGGLGDDTALARRLRDSVRSYYEHDQRIGPAAAALQIHANTLRYRLQQAEDIVGHPLGSDRLRIELALLVRDRVVTSNQR
ncbi:PucR family transcriptional regulator [Nocardioides sp. LML1-1-1.1]|uniref:PucR family transcriptional regulator n=1 Tax=Nocardioides sp. LML1-1-1.1 TaxID=3135248 RepID=UPI00343A0AA4